MDNYVANGLYISRQICFCYIFYYTNERIQLWNIFSINFRGNDDCVSPGVAIILS